MFMNSTEWNCRGQSAATGSSFGFDAVEIGGECRRRRRKASTEMGLAIAALAGVKHEKKDKKCL